MIAPEYSKSVQVKDPDIRTALFFIIKCATVLEEMTRDLMSGNNVNYEKYQEKISKYNATFEGILEEFEDEIFGEYNNSIAKDDLEKRIGHIGWKYFSLKNLNELFAIKLEKYSN